MSTVERFHAAMGYDAWRWLGAHPRASGGVDFRVWAPRAQEVCVKGDFSDWHGVPLAREGQIFAGFVAEATPGQLYKVAVRGVDGEWTERADPFAFAAELRPGQASRVAWPHGHHRWQDDAWMQRRAGADPLAAAMSIYEVHLGSWLRHADGRVWGYAEVADRLIAHVQRLGFTHVEFMPLAEHPYDPSWGYQVTGFFAPTSRYGDPDGLRELVDRLHQAGVGVLLDWVPAHFPKDAHALARFDGAPLFEYSDPRLGEHPDWGTLVFDYARPEVRSFLLASACYWLESFHLDGLRVDAVASMLYLDYSRGDDGWLPNRFGGRENLDAISLLQDVNRTVRDRFPGVVTIAEESTAFAKVTGAPPPPLADYRAGLGFSLKWNMGWMHDTLAYLGRDPVHRRWHHHELTFASSYAHAEAFVLPLSHDEVVHGKGSLVCKPGGPWQTGAAQLRLLYGLQWLSPGKKLLFMGGEFGQEREWDQDRELDWAQAAEPARQGLRRWVSALNRLYRTHPSLCASDHQPGALRWLDADDVSRSLYTWRRVGGGRELVVAVNTRDAAQRGVVVRVPTRATWRVVLDSSAARFGGGPPGADVAVTRAPMPAGAHGDIDPGVLLDIPAFSVVVLATEDDPVDPGQLVEPSPVAGGPETP